MQQVCQPYTGALHPPAVALILEDRPQPLQQRVYTPGMLVAGDHTNSGILMKRTAMLVHVCAHN